MGNQIRRSGRKMEKSAFYQFLHERIRVLDGAMGTMLQPLVKAGSCLEILNAEQPGQVRSVYSDYAQAGADIISTNTFGGSRIKLHEFGLGPRTAELNRSAAKDAKSAASGRALVAGVIGPTGKLIEPLGPLSFAEAVDVFREQAQALAEGGADCLLLETFSDLREIRAAILASTEAASLPILASMTFDENFTTFTGTDPVTAAVVLDAAGADAIGVNCSTGPEPMLEVLGRFAGATAKPLFAEPNAGLPRLDSGTARYDVPPEKMARFAVSFAEIGVSAIGTCCGSTPEHTRSIRRALGNRKPVARPVERLLRIASRFQTVSIGPGQPFCIIGERINPTNRPELAAAFRGGESGPILQEAQDQVREGAHALDVNAGVPGIDEAAALASAARRLSESARVPLCLDCTRPEALEAALREIPGKALINSVSGDAAKAAAILPLAAKYGAAVLCLAVDGRGIPKTAEERINVLRSVIEAAEAAGVPRSDLICDCLTLTVSTQPGRAAETLKALRMTSGELGLPTVLGVSNVSFGLPDRGPLNASFLSMAMASGLDAAILNPGDARMTETVRAASVLTLRDRDSLEYVRSAAARRRGSSGPTPVSAAAEEGPGGRVARAVLQGDRDAIGRLVAEALDAGETPADLNALRLVPAIQRVGRMYEAREIYLPQMILSAETMQKALAVLEPRLAGGREKHCGTVVICTVAGDVHDIGKNLVALFLRNRGFRVIDLGKDVPAGAIVERAVSVSADFVALSALMTTTVTEMPAVIRELRSAGCRARVIVGGAVVTREYAGSIGADGYAPDGPAAADLLSAWAGSEHPKGDTP
jgi:5-methyltetrahydrofolate--homocysteine methyltransferase